MELRGTATVTCTTTKEYSSESDSAINLTVNVPANSAASVLNTASAWGGGDLVHTSLCSAVSSSDMPR